jgi:hypothetical protein
VRQFGLPLIVISLVLARPSYSAAQALCTDPNQAFQINNVQNQDSVTVPSHIGHAILVRGFVLSGKQSTASSATVLIEPVLTENPSTTLAYLFSGPVSGKTSVGMSYVPPFQTPSITDSVTVTLPRPSSVAPGEVLGVAGCYISAT